MSLHGSIRTPHWVINITLEDNTSCISVVEAKIVTPRVKHMDIPLFFIQTFFTMVSLFQNMRSIMSCQQIFVTNHVRFQWSVVALRVWLSSISTYLVILNTTNSWSYMSLIWLNHIMGSVLYDIVLSVSLWAYPSFSEQGRLVWLINVIDNTRNIINNEFIRSFTNISIYPPWLSSTLLHVTNKKVF